MDAKKPATMRSLALELGVSAITVSRALRGTGEVRPGLAAKITRLARRRGYQADPVISSVLSKLGRGRGRSYLETVAFVWTHAQGSADAEYRGVCAQAAALGYRVEPVRPWEQDLAERDVARILWARGIRGVLLAPNHSSAEPRYDLDWTRLCPVLIGSSLRNTGIARVQRDYFHDARRALEHLRARGARRVGLVLDTSIHERTHRQYAAAFLAHAGPSPSTAAPFIHLMDRRTPDAEQGPAFAQWLRDQRPDAILADCPWSLDWLRAGKTGAKIVYAGLALHGNDRGATGMRPDFERIGMEAMRALDGLLRTGHLGLQVDPINLLVPGKWQDGPGR